MNHHYMDVTDDRGNGVIIHPYPGDGFMNRQFSSTHSSPTGYEDEVMAASSWHPHMAPPMSATPSSVTGSSNMSSVPTKTVIPLQKRRRVTRACDECRRKKIKCDGKQPCTHCTVYSYECTYDQPSNRRRNPAPQYIEQLESKLKWAQALLKHLLPGVDVVGQEVDPSKLPDLQASAAARVEEMAVQSRAASEEKAENDPLLDSMVEATGRLDIDETGHLDFHGHSSGMSYLTFLNKQAKLLGGELQLGSSSWPVAGAKQEERPRSVSQSPQSEFLPDVSLIPPRETAMVLLDVTLEKVCSLMRFIHRPSFMRLTDRLYDLRPEDYGDLEQLFLPLFYLALGVGYLFLDDEQIIVQNTKAEASKYFNAGRRMVELTDIRDIYSLQAVLLMVIYLQSTTRMSTCYSYIAIALSASVRMGLHRSISANFDPIEREVRKRIFWTCWKMDTHVGAILGLPKGIAPEDVDQEMPVAVDDENITKDGIVPQAEGTISLMAASNAHTTLLQIMAKIVKYVYPIKGVEASVSGTRGGYSVSQAKIHEIELDLSRWLEALPPLLRPGGEPPVKMLRCQYLLKISFAHVQLILYRPFVHYIISATTNKDESMAKTAYACLQVSRKIVRTTEEMRKLGLLNGAYWFTIYTTFFSIITLLYYVAVHADEPFAQAVYQDALLGMECLTSIKEKSIAADRCTISLAPLFANLSEKIRNRPPAEKPRQPKKRSRTPSQSIQEPDVKPPRAASNHASPGSATHSPPAMPLAPVYNQDYPPPPTPERKPSYAFKSESPIPPPQVIPDMNASMFSPDIFNFVPAGAGGQIFGGAPGSYGNLEDSRNQIQQPDPNSIEAHFYLSNGATGGEPMITDFFAEREWGDGWSR